jgi:Flp pilus assembly protein TadG
MKLVLAMLVVAGVIFGIALHKVQAELQRLSDAMNDRAIISQILGDIDQ